MFRFRILGLCAMLPVLAALVVSVGCGNKDAGGGGGAATPEKKPGEDKGKGGAKAALEAPTTATLKGKVVFDGEVPKPADLKADIEKSAAAADKARCLEGDTSNPLWKVDANSKAVANVVVWLRAPEGKYFKLSDAQSKRTDAIKIDQPYCAFEPHVVAVFPTYFDGKEQKPTGQKFHVANSATINHNTKWGGDALINSGANEILKPKGADLEINAVPGKSKTVGGEDLLNINCNIHPWMGAKAWVFDHPYSAVTKADGTYEIKNAPEGVELVLAYWHESWGGKDKAKTEKVTLKSGDNTHDLKVK